MPTKENPDSGELVPDLGIMVPKIYLQLGVYFENRGM